MKNRFWIKPNDEDIKEIGGIFNLQDAVIAIDSTDIEAIMNGAENAIVLSGKASGSNRCADAIEDAILHTCSVANDYDLFSAEKVIIYFFCPKEIPMLIAEFDATATFSELFHSNTEWKWGLSEVESKFLKVIITAVNLKKKPIV